MIVTEKRSPQSSMSSDQAGRSDGQHPAGARRVNLAGPSTLAMSVGLLIGAWCVGRSRSGDLGPGTQWLFWIGLLLVFLPPTVLIIMRSTGRTERLVLAVTLPLALQATRVVLYPTMFTFHDEFIHTNTLRSIEDSHHLFGANSLLPVSSRYPGMEIATDAIHALTGLSSHTSAIVVLMLARLVLTLALIGTVRRVTGSLRAACVASVVYACNPQAIFFNAQFSYQSFALPLAIVVVYAFAVRRRRAVGAAWWKTDLLPVAFLAVVVVSHHLTSALLVVAFAAWLTVDVVLARRHRRPRKSRGELVGMVIIGTALVAGWAALPGNPVFGYLEAIGSSSVSSIRDRLTGKETHQLFTSSGGITSPPWERIALVLSILIVFIAVLVAVPLVRRWIRRGRSLLALFGLIALAYPIIPIGHVTPGTGEVTDRASGFLFFGVGVVVALGPAFRSRFAMRAYAVPALSALLAVVFVGGVVLGAGATVAQLPGPFLVSADARSIDAANLAAAHWERTHLPKDSRVYADRDAGLLAAAIGGLHTVTHVGDDVDASRILLAPTFTAADRELIRKADIDYVIVDLRDSTNLPNEQVYVESGEYGGENRTRPVSAQALGKLGGVPGVSRIYSDGPLVIYDVRALNDH